MAIAVEMEFEGASLDQYDEICSSMGLNPGGSPPPGALFHWAAKTSTGIKVTDVWETKEQFEAFAQDKIKPLTAEAGITGPPQITFFLVHNYLTTP
jgi:hypothetical protein